MKKIRVALFSNYYWGACLLNEMLNGPCAPYVELVGIATDKYSSEKQSSFDMSYEGLQHLSPDQRKAVFYSRIWNEFYDLGKPFYEQSRCLLPELAQKNGISLFEEHWIRKTAVNENGQRTAIDSVTSKFADTLVNLWRPHLIISANYGQKIPTDVVKLVSPAGYRDCLTPGCGYEENPLIARAITARKEEQCFGCYNFHPATHEWPGSFSGGNVFSLLEEASKEGLHQFHMVLHQLTWEYDAGPAHRRSSALPLFEGMGPVEIYFACASAIIELSRQEISGIVKEPLIYCIHKTESEI